LLTAAQGAQPPSTQFGARTGSEDISRWKVWMPSKLSSGRVGLPRECRWVLRDQNHHLLRGTGQRRRTTGVEAEHVPGDEAEREQSAPRGDAGDLAAARGPSGGVRAVRWHGDRSEPREQPRWYAFAQLE